LVEGPDLLREAWVMPAPRKYTEELRERAIRMVRETVNDNPGLAHKRACQQVGDQLGIPGATLRNWFRSGVADAVASPAGASGRDPQARIVELEKENRELRRANAILRSASAFFAAELDRPSLR
jgi:transposase